MESLFQISINKIIIFFSLLFLICFAFFLIWNYQVRVNEYYSSHELIAKQVTKILSKEVERILAQDRILLSSFIDDNKKLIDRLVDFPEDDVLISSLNIKLSKYFLNYYSSSIATKDGEILIDNFDGYINNICVEDMNKFIKTGKYKVRMHPNPTKYHYDVFVKFNSQKKEYAFLTSFAIDSLSNILKLSSPVNHELYLVDKEFNYLIEITEYGERINIPKRSNYLMTKDEKLRILSEVPVPGTKWHIVDLHDKHLLSKYKNEIITRASILYIFIVIAAALFNLLLFVQVYKINRFKDSLLVKNQEIEVLNSVLNELNEKYSKQAVTDSLTSIYNRRYFDQEVQSDWNKAQRMGVPLYVIIFDIDYFKQYNDIYGHQKGDECIKIIAHFLSDYFKRANEFVARYGGEEFVAVNIGSSLDEIKFSIKYALKAFSDKEIEHKGSKIKPYLSISIGVASTDVSKVHNVESLIQLADNALYKAKENGRDQVVYSK